MILFFIYNFIIFPFILILYVIGLRGKEPKISHEGNKRFGNGQWNDWYGYGSVEKDSGSNVKWSNVTFGKKHIGEWTFANRT